MKTRLKQYVESFLQDARKEYPEFEFIFIQLNDAKFAIDCFHQAQGKSKKEYSLLNFTFSGTLLLITKWARVDGRCYRTWNGAKKYAERIIAEQCKKEQRQVEKIRMEAEKRRKILSRMSEILFFLRNNDITAQTMMDANYLGDYSITATTKNLRLTATIVVLNENEATVHLAHPNQPPHAIEDIKQFMLSL